MIKQLTQTIKDFTSLALVPILLAVGATASQAQSLEIGKNITPDPLTLQGQSGGTIKSDNCGFIPDQPSQVINITERINYMRLTVEAEGGQPTLLVDGPDGRFCVLADAVTGDNPAISGVWLQGLYKIYVGDRTGSQSRYTLSVSQQPSSLSQTP